MKIKIPKNGDMYSYLILTLRREAKRLMYEEFGHIFNHTQTQVEINVITDPELLYQECIQFENIMTKDRIFDNIKKYENSYSGTSMYVTHKETYDVNGLLFIPKIKLVFYEPTLIKLLVHYLYNIDLFFEYMMYSIRHEVGHMIELISCNGKTEREMDVRRTCIRNAQNAHFMKWNDIRNNDRIERMYEYYNMPQEKLANEYANVDVNRLVEYNRILMMDLEAGTVINIEGHSLRRPNNIQQTVYNRNTTQNKMFPELTCFNRNVQYR